MDNEQTAEIALYREKFRVAPIGQWSQAVGTFGSVMDKYWEFRPDHTGNQLSTGPFGGEKRTMQFVWREVADHTIECCVVKTTWWDWDVAAEDEGENAPKREPVVREFIPEEEDWIRIHYDFTPVPTDCGELIGMCEVGEDGALTSDFWDSSEPLSFSGGLSLPADIAITSAAQSTIPECIKHRNQLLGFPQLCEVIGMFGMAGILGSILQKMPAVLAMGILLPPIFVFLLACEDLLENARWKRICASSRFIAACWYLSLAAIAGVVACFIPHDRGWWIMPVFIVIGCIEPVGILWLQRRLQAGKTP